MLLLRIYLGSAVWAGIGGFVTGFNVVDIVEYLKDKDA